MPEELPDNRQTADKRNVVDGRLLIGDDDAANHHCLAIINKNLGVLRLGIERGDTLNSRNGRIDLSVLDVDSHENSAVLSDLRRHLKFEHGVDELDRDSVVNDRLHRDFCSLFDGRFLVILYYLFGLREELAYALAFGRGNNVVESKVGRREGIGDTARGRTHAQIRDERHCCSPAAAATDDNRRSRQKSSIAADWACAHGTHTAEKVTAIGGGACEGKLRTKLTSKSAIGSHDASLDLYLLGLGIEFTDEVVDYRHNGRDIADDQRVRAIVREHVAARREEFFEGIDHVLGLCVAERASRGDQFSGLDLRLGQIPGFIRFFLHRRFGGDAENVPVELFIEIVILQHDVESLVPRDVIENQRESAFDAGIHDHVQAADFMDQAEEVLQVHVLQIDGNGRTGVLRAALILRNDGYRAKRGSR